MDILSGSTHHVTDAVASIPFDKFADSFDAVTPDLDDVGDFAAAVATRGRRIGLRTVRTSARVVRQNPRFVVGAIAGLIALTAVAIFLKRRNETSDAVTVN